MSDEKQSNNSRFVEGYFYHGVKVSKWESDKGDGKKLISFSIEKTYKDKDGEYQKSKTFFSDDLDSLIQCLIAAKQRSVKFIMPKNEEEEKPF